MKPKNKALLVIVVAVVVVVGVVATYILMSARPTTLPIPAGTVIDKAGYSVSFTVAGGVGRLVGAWSANGIHVVAIAWSNYSWSWGPHFPCFVDGPWNEAVNVSLVPGTYTMVFGAGYFGWTSGGSLLVTQAIRLTYPGDSPGTNQTLLANWCVQP